MQKVVERNPAVSDLSAILPVIMEEKVYQKEGTTVMKKGDKADGFYFARDGKFQCVADDGAVVKEFRGGEIFGELGVFLSEPRALDVKSSTPNASAWFVDKKSYEAIAKLKGVKDTETQAIVREQYAGYADFLEKKRALRSFQALRKELTSAEMDVVANCLERCTFDTGEDVLLKGSEDTDHMYFVQSGNYEVIGVDKGFTALPNKKFFGELSFFLGHPRSATIRAASPLSLFKLSRKNLLNVVEETRFEAEYVALLAAQYRDAGLAGKYAEVLEYIAIKSRPKKELVSGHSILATVASGMFLVGMLPCLSPGIDENGVPHLFDLHNFGLGLPETQLASLLFAAVAFTGAFRLPPNTPLLRRHFFIYTTLMTIFNYMIQDSNIMAVEKDARFTFDLLTVNVGSVMFWAVFALSNVWTMKLISEAVCAPEKARSTIPLNGQAAPIVISAALMGLLLIQEVPACFLNMDKVAYAEIYTPYAQSHYETYVLTLSFTITAGMGYYMLVATLLFEGKLTQSQGTLLAIPIFEPVAEQTLGLIFDANPEAMAYAEYNNGIFWELHIYQLLLLAYTGAAAVAAINCQKNMADINME